MKKTVKRTVRLPRHPASNFFFRQVLARQTRVILVSNPEALPFLEHCLYYHS